MYKYIINRVKFFSMDACLFVFARTLKYNQLK